MSLALSSPSSLTSRQPARVGRPSRSLTLLSLFIVLSVGSARENLFASSFGPFARDLLQAFHAVETSCHAAIETPDVCFEVEAVGAGHLAGVMETVVDAYGSAGLGMGDWSSANGVWAVELRFDTAAYGTVDIYLTEVGRGLVRGMLVLTEP